MKNGILRALATGIHFMVFGCSAIVVGMVSYFINKYPHDTHIVYEEVIACITLGVYTFGMILPFIKAYRGYLVPLNLVMSYLWITSFIFASEDWSAGRCAWTGPGAGHCNIKRAIAAFTFLTMFFLICNIFAECLLWRTTRGDPIDRPTKERPSTAGTAETNGSNNV